MHGERQTFQENGSTEESLSLYRCEHSQKYRELQNVVAHLIMYQLHKFVFMWMVHNLFLQRIAKKIKTLHRHGLDAWVPRGAVRHE